MSPEREEKMKNIDQQLQHFFYPETVAVIGASKKQGKIGNAIPKNLVEHFNGEVYPVNPKYDKFMELPCYGSVSEIPTKVDVAVVVLPSKLIPSIVEECGESGITNIILISGGFKELGGEFKQFSQRTAKIAKKYGIRIIGPNCIGCYNPTNGFITFFQPNEKLKKPDKGNVAIISQSGTNGLSLLEWQAEHHVGLSKFVSYGNKLDVDEATLLNYLRTDEETAVIGIYMEALKNGRRFYEEAKKTVKEKPVVVLRGGRSELAAEAALSHTGFLGGKQRIYNAAFNQGGLIQVNNLESLFDTVKVISKQPLPEGGHVALVSNGAGPMVEAVQYIDDSSLTLSNFTSETKAYFKEQFPPYYVLKNPLDITGSAGVKDYRIALNGLIEDSNVDIITTFFVFQNAPLNSQESISMLEKVGKKARTEKKPILVCAAGGPHTKSTKRKIEKNRIPTYPTAERLIRAANALFTRTQRQ